MSHLIVNQKIYKQFNDTIYYISKDGEIYSTYAQKVIKPLKRTVSGKTYLYIDIFNKELKKQQHINVHKIVFETWIRPLKDGEQVNHLNDDSLDNRAENLYAGTQKENIKNCIDNQHRVGNVFYLTIFDKKINKLLTFCPANTFIEYSGHPNKSGSLNKFFNKNWFKKRYKIIEFKRIGNLNEYQNVTTIGDECTQVG